MIPDLLEYHFHVGEFTLLLADGGWKAPDGYRLNTVTYEAPYVVLRCRKKVA